MLHRASFARLALCMMLVLVLPGLAQQKDKKPDSKKQQTATPATDDQVAPDDFVVLITGACQAKPEEFSVRDCIRGVTRQEFEELLSLEPAQNSSPQARASFARQLGELIILSNEAKKRDLPKDPAVQEMMKFAELQVLAGLLVKDSLKKESSLILPSQVEQYYQTHIGEYQTAEFQRVNVPRKGDDAQDKDYAESLRARCASGEDLNVLQAEADERVGVPAGRPVNLPNQRRAMYAQGQQSIFDLKPGQCAVVTPDAQSFFVYKMVAMKTAPLADVQTDISKALDANLTRQSLANVLSGNVVSLNQKYFEPAQKPTK